jgi:hypothetical protein
MSDQMTGLNLESIKSWKRLGCLITLIGGLQMLILTTIAMIVYPGGYDFSSQYFSHLGLSKSTNGSPNTISQALFMVGLIGAGIGLIPFWIIIPTLFSELKYVNYVAYLGSFIGIFTSPLLIGVAVFPGDTQGALHGFCARYLFLTFSAAIFLYSIAIFFNRNYENIYGFVGIVFSVIIIMFIFRFFAFINPIMQKTIIYGFCLWSLYQISQIWKTISI